MSFGHEESTNVHLKVLLPMRCTVGRSLGMAVLARSALLAGCVRQLSSELRHDTVSCERPPRIGSTSLEESDALQSLQVFLLAVIVARSVLS